MSLGRPIDYARIHKKPEPPTLAELSADLGRPLRSTRERPVLGTIEALIATGNLRLIRSNALRTKLTTYAEFSEATIENIQRHDETYYRLGVNALAENLDTNQLMHQAEPDGERYVVRCGDSRAVGGEFRITLSRPEADQPPPAEPRDTAEVSGPVLEQ